MLLSLASKFCTKPYFCRDQYGSCFDEHMAIEIEVVPCILLRSFQNVPSPNNIISSRARVKKAKNRGPGPGEQF